MLTFISFILTILGCVNWLSIGMLQYDFVAGLFGFQGSLFSRIIYIIIGMGAGYFVIRIIANKGTVKIYEKKKKKMQEFVPSQVEASKEQTPKNEDFFEKHEKNDKKSKKNAKKSEKNDIFDFSSDFSQNKTDEFFADKQVKNERETNTLFDDFFSGK